MITITPTQRKLIQLASFYLLPLSLAIFAVTLATDSIFVKFGELAVYLVAANLFLKPLSVLVRHPLVQPLLAQAMTFRREIGVASFWLYLAHSMGMFLGRGLSIDFVLNPKGFLIWGAIAGSGMWILGLTSNNFSQRILKRNWKKVQMLAYVVLPLATFHAAKAEGEYAKFILINGAFVALKVAQWWVTKQRIQSPSVK